MRINHGGEPTQVYGGRFTGDVALEMLGPAEDESQPDIARVAFKDGAVTFWHTHPGGQKLLVLDGVGRIGMENEEVILQAGTYVDTPPNERHYHGAAEGQSCTILAITWGTTRWEESGP